MNAPSGVPLDELSADELRQQLASLTMLLDVTRRLAGEMDPIAVLQSITNEACRALDCDRASLYQYDPQRRELFTRVVTELEINEIRHQIDQGITGYVARHGRLANVPDPPRDPRWNSSVDRRTGYVTRNILAAPLRSPHDDSLLGVLELINKHDGEFTSFDERLLVAFSQHASVALDRARWFAAQQERETVEAAMQVARDVQRSFMPRQLPDVAGYDLASWWYPHQAVGGDYCDVVPLANGCFALVIADVSGHGLGPSLLMASARAALRALMGEQFNPAELLSRLAGALAGDLQDGRFITALLATIDVNNHMLQYANAGHGPALMFRQATRQFEVLPATGLPLGVLDDQEYAPGAPTQLDPGDLVLLCTDGIVEAMNSRDEPFGRERLEMVVRSMCDRPAAEIVERVAAEVSAYYVGDSPSDDLTVLVARRQTC